MLSSSRLSFLYKCSCRRDEAASRPKAEFVPKTLADLNIEGVSTEGLNGTNTHTYHHGTSIITTNSYQITRNTKPAPNIVYKPDPFDPWTFTPGIFCLFISFCSFATLRLFCTCRTSRI